MSGFSGWLLCDDSPLPPLPPYKGADLVTCAEGVATVTYTLHEGDSRGSHVVCRYIAPTMIEAVLEETTKDGDRYATFRDTGERRVFYGDVEVTA